MYEIIYGGLAAFLLYFGLKFKNNNLRIVISLMVGLTVFLMFKEQIEPFYQSNFSGFGITNGSPDGKSLCFKNGRYNKLGNFFLESSTANPGTNNGLILIDDTTTWKNITKNHRNETWAWLNISKLDKTGVDVSSIVNAAAKAKNIQSRQQTNGPPYINYFIKHVSQNSGVMLMKSGSMELQSNGFAVIVGQYTGNNWSNDSRKQYVVNLEGDMWGVPILGDEYELYFSITTDTCALPLLTPAGAACPPPKVCPRVPVCPPPPACPVCPVCPVYSDTE